MAMQFFAGGGLGKKTASADTRIQFLLGGAAGFFTHMINARITTGATAHVMTVMRSASRTTVATELSASGTALVVADALTDAAGNAIDNNDFLAVRLNNGAWHFSKISGWNSGTKTATLVTAIPTGRKAAVGGAVASFGVPGDSGHAAYTFDLADAVTNQIPPAGVDCSVVRAAALGEPLMIDIDNGTNASVVDYINWGGTKT